MDNLKQGLVDVDEIVMFVGNLQIDVPVSTREVIETFQHNLNRLPYFDYKISFDGGTTYTYKPDGINTDSTRYNQHVFGYADKTYLYFHYLWGALASPPATAYTIKVSYQVFVAEGTQ